MQKFMIEISPHPYLFAPFLLQKVSINFTIKNLNFSQLPSHKQVSSKMNSSKNISTPQNCQLANFINSSELLHNLIDFSQSLDKLELELIQNFFTLVEKNFKIGKEGKDD